MFITDMASKLYPCGFRSRINIKTHTETLMPAMAFEVWVLSTRTAKGTSTEFLNRTSFSHAYGH